MIAKIKLFNISIISHSHFPCVCVCGVYSLSKFQLYILFIIVTMQYIRFLELTNLITEGFYLLIDISPYPLPSIFGILLISTPSLSYHYLKRD